MAAALLFVVAAHFLHFAGAVGLAYPVQRLGMVGGADFQALIAPLQVHIAAGAVAGHDGARLRAQLAGGLGHLPDGVFVLPDFLPVAQRGLGSFLGVALQRLGHGFLRGGDEYAVRAAGVALAFAVDADADKGA